MSLTLFACCGGRLTLPDRARTLIGRRDGGHLCVEPPREVWERSELTSIELTSWSFLVAAAGRAMLDVLPQLDGGCINYWEAGNWALHDQAEPRGHKTVREHRRVHLHLFGRSPAATDASWRWGEAPLFPAFADRLAWMAGFERLTARECQTVVAQTAARLQSQYGCCSADITPWFPCTMCEYPTVAQPGHARAVCAECVR